MSEYVVGPDEAEDEATEVMAAIADGKTPKWPGMSYEQGVQSALDWVLGNREEKPYTEE